MTDRRRELVFRVVDNDARLFQVAHMFTQFYRCDEMLSWLIRNDLTGKNLWALVREEFGYSGFALAKFVLTKVKNEAELQPVIAGKDFITARRPDAKERAQH